MKYRIDTDWVIDHIQGDPTATTLIEDDLLDLSLAIARSFTTGAERHSLDQVLTQFGYSRDDLRDLT